jgi:hypothetical protein
MHLIGYHVEVYLSLIQSLYQLDGEGAVHMLRAPS